MVLEKKIQATDGAKCILSTRYPFLTWSNNQTHVPPAGGGNLRSSVTLNDEKNKLWFILYFIADMWDLFFIFFVQIWMSKFTGRLNCIIVAEFEIQHHIGADQNKPNNGWGKTELHLGYFCQDFPWQFLLEDIIGGWKWTVWSSVPPLWASLVGLDAPRQRLPIIDKVPCLGLVPYARSDSRPWYLSSSSALSLSHCSRTLYLISHVGGICRWGLPI